MKKVLFIFCCSWACVGYSQFISAKSKTPVKKYKQSYTKVKKVYEDPSDSAFIYYTLGWEAYKGQNFDAARYYWERGANCETNIPSKYSSAFRLALMHQNGEGVGVNQEIAFYYYTLAYAEGKSEGNVDATKNIASYYENGFVMVKDNFKALEWYTRAKNQGNRYCNDDIARVRKKITQQ